MGESLILTLCRVENLILHKKGLMTFFCQVARNGFFWPKCFLKFFFWPAFQIFTMTPCILVPQLLIHPQQSYWEQIVQVSAKNSRKFARNIDFKNKKMAKFGQKNTICAK